MGTTIDLASTKAGLTPGTSARLTAYVARPPQSVGSAPGVVVIHEAFGVEDVTRRQADRLALMGYLTIVPDLFSDGGPMRCLRATFRAMRSGTGRAFQDIAAARQWLVDEPGCTGNVGIIGFCMGGGFALLCAAPAHGFGVSSVNYGFPPDDLEVLRGACPIVASYGGTDRSLRGTAQKLERELGRMGVTVDAKEYPDAGHSFLNDAETGPWFLRPVLRVMGVGPEPASAADAWRRIEAFFSEHLCDEGAAPAP